MDKRVKVSPEAAMTDAVQCILYNGEHANGEVISNGVVGSLEDVAEATEGKFSEACREQAAALAKAKKFLAAFSTTFTTKSETADFSPEKVAEFLKMIE